MERYLDGEELPVEEVAHALKDAVTRGELFPVACGVATKNLGTTALLDLLVEGVPSPAKKGPPIDVGGDGTAAFVFKTIADPFAGRINVFRVLSGSLKADSAVVNARGHAKERIGQLLEMQGKEHSPTNELGAGDIGAVAKLKDTQTGDLLLDAERDVELPSIALSRARDELRRRAEGEGRRGEDGVGAPPSRRGGSDDPPPARPADRGGAALGPVADPRRSGGRAAQAPVRRGGRAAPAARAVPRDDPQGGAGAGAVQEADRRPRPVRRLSDHRRAARGARGLRVRRQDRRRRDPAELPPGGRQGRSRRRCSTASSPARRCRASA